jgi:hypothetical protein
MQAENVSLDAVALGDCEFYSPGMVAGLSQKVRAQPGFQSDLHEFLLPHSPSKKYQACKNVYSTVTGY